MKNGIELKIFMDGKEYSKKWSINDTTYYFASEGHLKEFFYLIQKTASELAKDILHDKRRTEKQSP